MKEAAASVAAHIPVPAAVSNRVETAHPPVEENFDAPPMTAEELAEQAAADTQPVRKKAQKPEPVESDEEVVVIPAPATVGIDPMSPMPPMAAVVKKKPRKKPAVNTSGRITPAYDIPVPDTPLPTPKKAAKKASIRPAKKAVKKSKAKKAVKKAVAKTAAKKTKKAASKTTAKKAAKKTAKKQSAKKSAKKSPKKKKKSKK
jgi:hypothetical protein